MADVAMVQTKTCPACAESIKTQALLCRFCGFDYRTLGQAAARRPNQHVTPARATNSVSMIAVAGVSAIIASLIGAFGSYYDYVSPSEWHLFGSGDLLIDVGNGISGLQAPALVALAALWLLAAPDNSRRIPAALLGVLGLKYVLNSLGALMAIAGEHLTLGLGFYLDAVCGLIVLLAGLVSWQAASRTPQEAVQTNIPANR